MEIKTHNNNTCSGGGVHHICCYLRLYAVRSPPPARPQYPVPSPIHALPLSTPRFRSFTLSPPSLSLTLYVPCPGVCHRRCLEIRFFVPFPSLQRTPKTITGSYIIVIIIVIGVLLRIGRRTASALWFGYRTGTQHDHVPPQRSKYSLGTFVAKAVRTYSDGRGAREKSK